MIRTCLKCLFLPADLFQPNGSWVLVSAQGGDPAAPAHVAAFFGRSTFLIFMRLPAGREATLAYLKQTSEVPAAMVAGMSKAHNDSSPTWSYRSFRSAPNSHWCVK